MLLREPTSESRRISFDLNLEAEKNDPSLATVWSH